jgi:hypothetical protein
MKLQTINKRLNELCRTDKIHCRHLAIFKSGVFCCLTRFLSVTVFIVIGKLRHKDLRMSFTIISLCDVKQAAACESYDRAHGYTLLHVANPLIRVLCVRVQWRMLWQRDGVASGGARRSDSKTWRWSSPCIAIRCQLTTTRNGT